jgi:protein-disulfide isomerase
LSRWADRRRRPALLLAAVVVFSATLIGASWIGSGETDARATAVRESSLAGIAQAGAALGNPSAPVTLVEYADLQCPYCAEWAQQTLPVLVDDYVRTGKLRIVFRGLAFIGPDSQRALRVAVAAGRQNRLWDVVEDLYLRQGAENGGWVTEALLEETAGPQALAQSNEAWVARRLLLSSRAAEAAGVTGTPAFQLGRTGGALRLVPLHSLGPEGLRPAIEAALAS